jgi:DNA-binding response OmpR family regulator
MLNEREIKMLALADRGVLSRIENWTKDSEISIAGIISASDAVHLLNIEKFDIVMIDSNFRNAAVACELIFEMMQVPIVLLVKTNHADWRSLLNWKVDGFIKDNTDPVELSARLRALSRRNIEHFDKCVYLAG